MYPNIFVRFRTDCFIDPNRSPPQAFPKADSPLSLLTVTSSRVKSSQYFKTYSDKFERRYENE